MWGSFLEASNFTKSAYILSIDSSYRSSAFLLVDIVRLILEVLPEVVSVEHAAEVPPIGDDSSGVGSWTVSVSASGFRPGWDENPPSRRKMTQTPQYPTHRRTLAVPQLMLLLQQTFDTRWLGGLSSYT